MRKINYFYDCEKQYLIELGLWDSNRRCYTKEYWKLNKYWNELRDKHNLVLLPKQVSKLIVGKYTKLVDYYFIFDKFIENNIVTKPKKDGTRNIKQFKSDRKKFLCEFYDVFNYSVDSSDKSNPNILIPKYSKKIANFFIKHAPEMNLYSCAYCEAGYTGIYLQNKTARMTFDIDHFFQKEQYPIFALSLYNFVPSCQFCNSRVKGSNEFKKMYKLNTPLTSKDKYHLLRLSPTSPYYNFDSNSKIRVIPSIPTQADLKWRYTDEPEMFSVHFDCDDENTYKKSIDAFYLTERYNSASIKTHSKYLQNLKKTFPDEYLFEIANFLTKNGYNTTFEQVKNFIFHTDENYQLLEKLRDDILE